MKTTTHWYTLLLSTIYITIAFVFTVSITAFIEETREIPPEKPSLFYDVVGLPSKADFEDSLVFEQFESGKGLFRNNCASCHNKNMKDDMTGPALGGVQERWAEYPKADLYNWIRNSQALIHKDHPKATQLWQEWKIMMTAFPNLSDEQIESILVYVEHSYKGI